MDKYSFIANADPTYIESLYKKYKQDPASLDPDWSKFFEGFDFAQAGLGIYAPAGTFSAAELKVYNAILAFREKGHLIANTNPIRKRKDRHAGLSLQELGFETSDLQEKFKTGEMLGLVDPTLQDILDRLHTIYCGSIGYEYDYIIEPDEKQWLQDRIEKQGSDFAFSTAEKKRILLKLNETVVLEHFLDKKYIGQKRFSLEGGESTIPALDAIISDAAEHGTEEVVIGMAHRGRLNVLANILGKTYEQIFNEFEGNVIPDTTMGDGDVKYHLGYSSQVETAAGKKIHLKLTPNPSHLESVNAVMEGFVRAKQDILYDGAYIKTLPVTIHGDAAIAGQGVVYELLQMSGLKGYRIGGTLHFIINNQIGFTTDFDDARTSNYCTSVASTVLSPVLHVNGDDAEAVVWASRLAAEYLRKYHKDVFVDMVCYRLHGHNEGDDPKYTQPALYKMIEGHSDARKIYVTKLEHSHAIDQQLAKEMEDHFWSELQKRLDFAREHPLPYQYQAPEEAWRKLRKVIAEKDFAASPETAVPEATIKQIAENLGKVPQGFTPLPKIKKLFAAQQALIAEGKIDWALGELVAYASILLEGHDVRMSGQDVRRGTFSHRHAVLRDAKTNEEYIRLNHLGGQQGKFRIYNSPLNEFAVLGFEFGYSLASPDNLVLWEAQFGDFANGAQTIIDQFIAASVSKWQRMSGLVLLLPHGYEGQGAEHSSARLERFLQLSAEENMVVANISTPANFFHALRRQLAWDFRRPLVVMSPKSLLRHPLAQSAVSELSQGGFREIIPDKETEGKKLRRILLCSGKIYYDLYAYREENKIKDIAILRIEQLYPFPLAQLHTFLDAHTDAEICWVQEEPANMGAQTFVAQLLRKRIKAYISREASASPATGFAKVHAEEQHAIITSAFAQILA